MTDRKFEEKTINNLVNAFKEISKYCFDKYYKYGEKSCRYCKYYRYCEGIKCRPSQWEVECFTNILEELNDDE